MKNIIGHKVNPPSLPEKLEDFIFNDLLKNFQGKLPNHEDAKNEVGADETKVKGCLAKYFSGSFEEANQICQHLLSIETIKEIFKNKEEINILDIGSGSGGNLMGLLQCLKEKGILYNKKVKIFSIDGNKFAFKQHRRILDNLNFFNGKNNKKFIDYRSHLFANYFLKRFKNRENFQRQINEVASGKKFDIIMSFQFVNEPYNRKECKEFHPLYRTMAGLAYEHLRKDGLFILSDVNYKLGTRHFSQLMNSEIIPYLQKSERNLKCILPLSCAFWYEKCSDYDNCFQQKIFNVYYKNEGWFRDRGEEAKKMFKFVYKIFAHKNLAGKILSQFEKKDIYKVSKTNFCYKGGRKSERDIPSGKQQNIADAFTLSSLNEQNEI